MAVFRWYQELITLMEGVFWGLDSVKVIQVPGYPTITLLHIGTISILFNAFIILSGIMLFRGQSTMRSMRFKKTKFTRGKVEDE